MTRPRRLWLTGAFLCFSTGAAIALFAAGLKDFATLLVALVALSVATYALYRSLPARAELFIEAVSNPASAGLVFFEPEPGGPPRDLMVQQQAIVGNAGDRKAVVLTLSLLRVMRSNGTPIALPFVSFPIPGTIYRMEHGWDHARGQQTMRSWNELPPFNLDGDDVIVVRFRVRGGVDWSDAWTTDKLKAAVAALAEPPSRAVVEATYRRGKQQIHVSQEIVLVVDGWEEYRAALEAISDSSTGPTFQYRPINPMN